MGNIPSQLTPHLRGVALITPWALALLAQDLALSLLLPLRAVHPQLTYQLASRIAWSCWAWIQFYFQRVNGAQVAISGDPIPAGESAVVICNHVGWSDFYMIQALASRAGMLEYCRYFAKAQLKRVPLLGWGLMAMGMPLVTRNCTYSCGLGSAARDELTFLSGQQDRRELDRVFQGITHYHFPVWLISFSEATRFTPKKYAESQAWCEANKRPQPQHLLYPRTKGFIATVQAVRQTPHVRAVYDLTMAYQQGAKWQACPPFWETLSRPRLSEEAGYRFEVHVRRWKMEEIPEEEKALANWIEAKWVEKGLWLEGKRLEWAREVKEVDKLE